MSTFNFFLDYAAGASLALAAWIETLDPIGTLYALLAGTYCSAALAAAADDHHGLRRCYLMSALVHALISAAHSVHL